MIESVRILFSPEFQLDHRPWCDPGRSGRYEEAGIVEPARVAIAIERIADRAFNLEGDGNPECPSPVRIGSGPVSDRNFRRLRG